MGRIGKWVFVTVVCTGIPALAVAQAETSGLQRQGGVGAYTDESTPPEVLRTSSLPYRGKAIAFAETQPVRDWPAPPIAKPAVEVQNYVELIEIKNADHLNPFVPGAGAGASAFFTDPLLRLNVHHAPLAMPSPSLVFAGPSGDDRFALFGNRVTPPDTQGDVGIAHYVSMVNGPIGIYNKTTGALSVPQFKLSTLFSSLPPGNLCRTNDDGDPIVLFDPLAQRWVVSQFALASTSSPPWFECIAVSKTSDPTGAWYVWGFQTPDNGGFPDYPKMGVWTDAYYMTTHQNGFLAPPSAAGRGTGFFAFDRNKMLAGDPNATYIYFDRPTPGEGGIIPSDIDGMNPPPPGNAATMIRYTADEFGGSFIDGVLPYQFVPDFTSPANSTLTVLPAVAVAAFDARQPSGRTDIEQPAPATAANNLDALNDRAMFRVSYRNLGTIAAPINSYTMAWGVNVSGVNPTGALQFTSGVRWVELRRDGAGVFSVRDQGTHAASNIDGATGTNYWMPHIAQDAQGNVALGYSESSTTTFPTISWAGRTGSSPASTLNEGSATMFAGTGIQNSTSSRWGDYSSMSIDPVDDCTFYYHTETRLAAANASSGAWSTQVGAFKFPTCTSNLTRGTLTVNVTACSGGAPVPNAIVNAGNGYVAGTNASGQAILTMVTGNYTVVGNITNAGSTPANVTITDGGNAILNICLTGQPVVQSNSFTVTAESFNPPNGAIDPGETVTVDIPVTNNGLGDATDIVGTLQATGGVTAPGAAQSYGALTVGGSATRSFTFTASPSLACGNRVTMTVQFADGPLNLGNRTYVATTGVVTGSSTQTVSYTGPAVTVPDNNLTGVNITLPVSGLTGSITDLNFRFDQAPSGTCDATLANANSAMDHTFVGDLIFKLTAPSGANVSVMQNRGGTRENICQTLLDDDNGFPALSTLSNTSGQTVSGNFAPDAPLSVFDTLDPNGNWVLNVVDNANADTGSMRRFSIVMDLEQRTCVGALADGLFANGFEN
ncbi:proprotein convertase P-domain-containing protein [Ahniella affigens]|nr:proprotein convertase P-domain-containing protein [Ahniella affigens]